MNWLARLSPRRRRLLIVALILPGLLIVAVPAVKQALGNRFDQDDPLKYALPARLVDEFRREGIYKIDPRFPEFSIDPAERVMIDNFGRQTLEWATFQSSAAREFLEYSLKVDPDHFYSLFLLALWHRQHGDASLAPELERKAFRNAPTIIVQQFLDEQGNPAAHRDIGRRILQCANETGFEGQDKLMFYYPVMTTDENGMIYMPCHRTLLYPANFDGKDVYFEGEWRKRFYPESKVAMLPPITIIEPRPVEHQAEVKLLWWREGWQIFPMIDSQRRKSVNHLPKQSWYPDGSIAKREEVVALFRGYSDPIDETSQQALDADFLGMLVSFKCDVPSRNREGSQILHGYRLVFEGGGEIGYSICMLPPKVQSEGDTRVFIQFNGLQGQPLPAKATLVYETCFNEQKFEGTIRDIAIPCKNYTVQGEKTAPEADGTASAPPPLAEQ